MCTVAERWADGYWHIKACSLGTALAVSAAIDSADKFEAEWNKSQEVPLDAALPWNKWSFRYSTIGIRLFFDVRQLTSGELLLMRIPNFGTLVGAEVIATRVSSTWDHSWQKSVPCDVVTLACKVADEFERDQLAKSCQK